MRERLRERTREERGREGGRDSGKDGATGRVGWGGVRMMNCQCADRA